MGIESEQLVFDYLSRVGDLAHATSMTAAQRARLVGDLRAHIERARAAEGGAGATADVDRILARLGKPEEIVAASVGGASVPAPRSATRTDPAAPEAGAGRAASPPHLAGIDELGPNESDPDWWRTDPRPYGEDTGVALGGSVPGFVGGIELPEMLRPPGAQGTAPQAPGGSKPLPAAGDAAAVPDPAAAGGRWRFLRALRRTAAADRVPRAGGFVELIAVALLVAGGVLGSLLPLALGWLAAYWSPRLTRNEVKWATFGVPGLTGAGALVWLWGRSEGRWGTPIGDGGDAMQYALADTWPVVLRVAAFATALYVLWRARRPRA
jgi:hypothetical protein